MGTVSRVHTFASGAVLTAAQLNNEFDNLLTSSAINGGLDATNLGVTAGQITASKALVVDSNRDLDDTSASNQINNLTLSGTLKLADNKALSLGSNDDITIQYDETTNDALEIAAAVEGAALAIVLKADQGDDAGDEWKVGVADGGALTFGNDIASAGTYVTGLTVTPNSTLASWLFDFEGDVDIGGDTLSFNGAATIDTSGNNALTIDAGSATLTLDGGTIESDATTLSFDAAISIDSSGNNAITVDAGTAILTLDGGTIESDATTLSFDAATSIDTSGNNNLTLSAGTATLVVTAGDVTVYDDNNNADTSLAIGTSATEALFIQALNGGFNKTLEELRFTTKTASATADHGKMTFYVDDTAIATIDDGGINLESGLTYQINGSNIADGDFSGPGSSTDNALVRFDGTGGKTGQNSGLIVDDSNNVSGANSITMADGKEIIFGSNDDIKVEYDEAGADALLIQASVDDAPVAIVLSADASADAGDDWKINAANGGALTFGNDIASAGTFVTGLTITPHATTASWSLDFEGDVDIGGDTLSFNGAATVDTSGNNNLTLSAGTATLGVTAGDVTIYDDNNNADTSLAIGTSATEALFIEALNGGSNKTLEELRFTTKTASGTGDHGKMSFYVDEAEIATIDDGGIDLASGMSFTVAGAAVGGGISWSGSNSNGIAYYKDSDEAYNSANFTFDGTDVVLTSSTSAKPVFTIQNTNADATSGEIKFDKDSASSAADDVIGLISFYGSDADENSQELFAKIEGYQHVATAGSEEGGIRFSVMSDDGEMQEALTIKGGGNEDIVNVVQEAGVGGSLIIGGFDGDIPNDWSASLSASWRILQARGAGVSGRDSSNENIYMTGNIYSYAKYINDGEGVGQRHVNGQWYFDTFANNTSGEGASASSTTVATLNASGDFSITGSYSSSDERMKSEIETIPGAKALETVKAISGKTFKKLGNPEFGFVAQDLQKVDIAKLSVKRREMLGGNYLDVNYSMFAGLHNEAIKELIAQIETLQNEVNALKAG